jgi:hypothetical protein
MYSRWVRSLLFVGAVALSGCDRDGNSIQDQLPTATLSPAVNGNDTPAPQSEPPASPSGKAADKSDKQSALAPIKKSGKGDQASTKFELQAGLSTWQITHDGRSNVQISLLKGDGKEVDMPLNEIGRYNGTKVVRVNKAGEYLLNVKADGKWTVTIEQPRPTTAPAKPLAHKGKGPSVSPFVTLPKGLNVFKVTHAGDGVFRVKLYDSEGKLVEQIAAVIGEYDGSKAITLEEEGIYTVGVSANGEWSLKID